MKFSNNKHKMVEGSKCSCQKKPLWNLDAPTAFENLPTKGSTSRSLSSERYRESERHLQELVLLWKGHTKSQRRSAATLLTISPTKVPHSRCFSGHNSVLLKIVAQFHKQVGTNWSQLLKYCIPSVLVVFKACLLDSLLILRDHYFLLRVRSPRKGENRPFFCWHV